MTPIIRSWIGNDRTFKRATPAFGPNRRRIFSATSCSRRRFMRTRVCAKGTYASDVATHRIRYQPRHHHAQGRRRRDLQLRQRARHRAERRAIEHLLPSPAPHRRSIGDQLGRERCRLRTRRPHARVLARCPGFSEATPPVPPWRRLNNERCSPLDPVTRRQIHEVLAQIARIDEDWYRCRSDESGWIPPYGIALKRVNLIGFRVSPCADHVVVSQALKFRQQTLPLTPQATDCSSILPLLRCYPECIPQHWSKKH
jgi:hypothetical protein